VDLYPKSTRSYVMSRIRKRNTRPEILLRRALFAAGVRGYRLHAKLPGRPDVIFPKARLAVFVDGCFWHQCSRCKIPVPQSNRAYWEPKLARNVARDRKTNRKLRALGWSVLHLWEHQVVRDPQACAQRVLRKRSEKCSLQRDTSSARMG
jgi:DNA mismatch endonuclease (patch repair protein)